MKISKSGWIAICVIVVIALILLGYWWYNWHNAQVTTAATTASTTAAGATAALAAAVSPAPASVTNAVSAGNTPVATIQGSAPSSVAGVLPTIAPPVITQTTIPINPPAVVPATTTYISPTAGAVQATVQAVGNVNKLPTAGTVVAAQSNTQAAKVGSLPISGAAKQATTVGNVATGKTVLVAPGSVGATAANHV